MISKMISNSNTVILAVSQGKIISSVSLILCNTDPIEDVSVDLFLQPQGLDPDTNQETQIVKQFEIPQTDTMLWSTERFILNPGQRLIQRQSKNGVVTCNLSYLEL